MSSSRDPALEAYLRTLGGRSPDGWFMEIRHRVASGTLAAEFFPVHDVDAIAAAIGRRSAITDVYVGCAPRMRRSGTKRDVGDVWVLWAECDGEAAAAAASRHRPAPGMVIASGSGSNVHAYWPLAAPVGPAQAEHANLRLAVALGADRACFDASRILRPPSTLNYKHRPPAPVVVSQLDVERRYDARVVVADTPDLDLQPIMQRWRPRSPRSTRDDPLLRVDPPKYVTQLLGQPARAGRKVACPFHADEHPSLHVYPTAGRGWCCFSCGRGGSIYDLAAGAWGLGTRGADFRRLRERLLREFQPVIAPTREISR